MKTSQSSRRSKRISLGLSKRQLFLVAGAFLILPVVFTTDVSAQDSGHNKAVMLKPLDASPLLLSEKENEAKLKHIEENYRIQSEMIQRKLSDIEKAKKETATIGKTKLSLEEEIAATKKEIAKMKLQVAEKKALEEEQARIERERTEAVESVHHTSAASQPQYSSAPVSFSRGQSSNNVGNRYTPGQCTYYVYERRPDIGSFWGNANQWIYSAQADGYATGSAPAVGAIAVAKGEVHVAYVEGVSGNMVTISEMNYGGPWRMNTRTVPASNFLYIY